MAVKNIVIKRGNNIIASVPPTSMSLTEKVMGGGVITASFTYHQAFAFMIGDFIEISNVTFKLNVLPKVTKESTNKYIYDCVFEDQFFDLGKTEFMVIGDVEFDLVGDLMTFVQLLVQNLNRTGSGWTVGSVQDSTAKNIHFSCENCLSVAQKLCSQENFDCEMYLVGKQINFHSFGTVTGHVLKYGY
ncbi:MAG TPA: hypothetical protein VK145_02770, partial [Candidatus Nanoarchaeia archaeon]|nr:hypothetical protein [Candidatus Nanoarchaeia archaeon]